MLSCEDVSKRLNEFLKEYGVKNKHIAEKAGLSETTICLFRKGERELSQDKLRIINALIDN